MKHLSLPSVWPVLLAGLFANPSPATAQSYWDPGALKASPGSGGAGTWNAANVNWWVSGSADSTWTAGNIAYFEGSAGTVTVSAAETADGLTFTTAGYTLAGSSTLTLGGTTPTVAIPAGTTTINTLLAGTAGLTISGGGRLILGAANTYTGDTTVSAGSALQINNVAGAGASSGTIALGTGGLLTISNRVNNAAVANPITGDSTSVINVILSASINTYLGGSLAGFYGTIVVTNSGGAAGSDLAGINTAPPLTMPATAAGWLVASNAELYLGIGSGVEAAPITINGPGYGAGYGAIRLDSGTISGNILLNGSTTNNQIGGAGASAVTFSGVISDGGRNYGLNVIGAGSTPASKVFVLSGQNTYGGQTTLSAGELQVAAAENPGISGPLGRSNALSTLYFSASGSAGALQYSSANQYDYSARFATSAGQKYKIDVNGQSVSFASPLTSSGGTFLLFDTAGGGTLTFNAANTYTGGTTISNGTLDVGSGSIVGGVTVNGGILQLDNPASLSPGTTLTLVSGVTVNLNYAGTQEITDLFVDGTQQMPGVYGTGANNPSGIFIGSGTLTVVGKSPTTVSSAAINGANQLAISWASVPGANYNVYSTTNLSQPIYWTLVNPSPIPAAGTTTSYTLPGSIVGQPQLFVRVQQ